jgi:hypothetical protein
LEGRGKFFVRRVVIGEGVGIGTLQRLAGDFVRHRHPAMGVALVMIAVLGRSCWKF